jgi:hypothetical protein
LKLNLDGITHLDFDLFSTVLPRENEGVAFFHGTSTEAYLRSATWKHTEQNADQKTYFEFSTMAGRAFETRLVHVLIHLRVQCLVGTSDQYNTELLQKFVGSV